MMLFTCGAILATIGGICLKEPELAWFLWERDHQLMGQVVQRPINYRQRVRDAGWVFLLLGAIAIMLQLRGL